MSSIQTLETWAKLIDGDCVRRAKSCQWRVIAIKDKVFRFSVDHDAPLRRVAALLGPYIKSLTYDSDRGMVDFIIDLSD